MEDDDVAAMETYGQRDKGTALAVRGPIAPVAPGVVANAPGFCAVISMDAGAREHWEAVCMSA